jgi:DNA polymerase I
MTEKKLFLLDGMALIYRAFFSFSQNHRITSYGLNTSAIYGFTNTLFQILEKQKPSHIAVVFDTSAPTARHEEFAAYKAHREAMPEDLKKSIPHIFNVIRAFNIPVITLDGYEADDIIGTIAWEMGDIGHEVYMMTPDKDFAQLVRSNVYIYKPGRGGKPDEVMGVQEVLAKWEIERIDQVIDILGLWGDSVDNIPGVPGIGEKTSKKLIAQYGSMENILAHTHELKGKQKENFENFAEQALLSKRLATIDTKVPIDYTEEQLLVEPYNTEELEKLFDELEFKNLSRRILGKEPEMPKVAIQGDLFSQAPAAVPGRAAQELAPVVNSTSFDPKKANYRTANTEAIKSELLAELEACTEFCFDTETTGLSIFSDRLIGISFCTQAGKAYYLPVSEEKPAVLEEIKLFLPFFEGNKLKIAHNAKFDIEVLGQYGVKINSPVFDTMLAHYVIEPDMRHKMDILSENYLNYKPIGIEELIGKKGKNQLSLDQIDQEKVSQYACEDADITLQLKHKLEPMLAKRNVKVVFDSLETPLIDVLKDIEMEGIRVDANFLNSYSLELEKQQKELLTSIYELAGEEFLVSSPQQVGNILFDKLKLTEKAKKTKTGQYQTDEETLSKLSEHEIVAKILEYRGVSKLKSTYVDALPALIEPSTGRIHTSFNQAVAATGRLSSNNPNLQNIPIRTEMGREVRKAFIPRDKDHVILSADYSQIELRVIAHVSQDQGMKDAFEQNLDIHTATAAKVFGVSLAEVDGDMRRKAKTVNFGIIYGISAFGLSQRLGIPRKEAAEIIENYFTQFGNIKKYMDDTIEFAKENGYVETIMGRRRYIRDINSGNATVRGFAERNAINAPIQGSAADMIKLAMINIQKWLRLSSYKTKMILQVHDELLFDVPRSEIAEVQPKIIELMSKAIKLDVPVLVEASHGENWLEAH